ncbi:hypothetical protein MmiAt1_13780 [Methanimicrococcus sp. At1]|uniref:Uncharacterized protein n=1 Tax=Methanimicrococcus hacksteinii TaxID=3028293 RepID=A0ABU3VQU6_9EURY|nr:hypothetical protein [Methanimicrococcus sp. At1]MDV0445782.1 hypothetical protein [Methanimicrococcus sp. At1]
MNAEDEWDEIDIEIDLDEINEILGEKINTGKKVLKEKEAHYAELLKAYKAGKKNKKDGKKSKDDSKKGKKKSKDKKLTQDEKYIAYGAVAALTAYAAYRMLHRK